MNSGGKSINEGDGISDRLESFGIYRLAREAFNEFWDDSEILGKDYRGRELVKQQVRSLDSKRTEILARIIGGLTETIRTIESRPNRVR